MLYFSLVKKVRSINQPCKKECTSWIKQSIIYDYERIYIEATIVDMKLAQMYNSKFRNKDYATNIISLSYADEATEKKILYGELILCHPIITKEALEQNKPVINHYAHLIVHGTLHLQGLNHVQPDEAYTMENEEIKILSKFGINSPYE